MLRSRVSRMCVLSVRTGPPVSSLSVLRTLPPSRTIATDTSALPGTSRQPTKLFSSPALLRSTHVTEPADEDEIIAKNKQVMYLTASAEKQISKIMAKPDVQGLRLMVESGGCHGYQYRFNVVTGGVEEDDYIFEFSNSPARMIIDASSLRLLAGSHIDYATELIGSAFRVAENPQAVDDNGCGCGVSYDLKEID